MKKKKLGEELLSKQGKPFSVPLAVCADEVTAFCNGYMSFLNRAKTEREASKEAVSILSERGFQCFDPDKAYRPGDRVYWLNHKKSVIAAVIGTKPFEEGFLITAAHVDSPRLDVKPKPLYEETNLAFLKTHYYGGIKKYQWTTIPLAIHGTVVLKDGREITVCIGEDTSDPVFYITDLLPHLARKAQGSKTMGEIISGEQLNIILGSQPYEGEEKDAVKINMLRILNERYGMIEDDFISAELEVVPAYQARYIGLDRSFIGAYGQDDRMCGYTALMALAEIESPSKTCVVVLADKEEIGSVGNTGLCSDMLKNFISLLCAPHHVAPERVYLSSKCLSADVNVAYDPNFPEVYERRNAAYLNCGPTLSKYTGSGGKGGSNDASAEYLGELRRVFDEGKVPWQIGELGKVDEGGGGTVARYVSSLGIETIDIGVGLLSMHSPYELSSCYDVYALYSAISCFFSKL